ncbi:hypothetical protein [Ideonella sp.]|uniref:hypothetical protein n=1 Tax=Ideonella sp. TaxID=1929293 RepID=UPI0035AF7E79
MTIALRADDGSEIPLSPAQATELRQTIGAMPMPVALTPQEIDAPSADVLSDVDAIYRAEAAPFTRYRSDGERLLVQSDEGHKHVEEDIAGLPTLLTQLATDNGAALAASSQALIAAQNAAEDATAAQEAASAATVAANDAVLAAGAAASAADTAQRTADSAVSAAASAQEQVDVLAGEISAATSAAALATEVAAKAQADVAEVAGVPFVVVGAMGLTAQARQLAAGSRIQLTDGGPGQTLQIQSRVDVATQFTAGQAVAFIDLQIEQPGTLVRWDARLSNNARLTLSSDATLDKPAGLMGGQPLKLKLTQADTGGYALGFGDRFKWPGDLPPVLGGASGDVTMLSFIYDQADDVLWAQVDAVYKPLPQK